MPSPSAIRGVLFSRHADHAHRGIWRPLGVRTADIRTVLFCPNFQDLADQPHVGLGFLFHVLYLDNHRFSPVPRPDQSRKTRALDIPFPAQDAIRNRGPALQTAQNRDQKATSVRHATLTPGPTKKISKTLSMIYRKSSLMKYPSFLITDSLQHAQRNDRLDYSLPGSVEGLFVRDSLRT